MIHRAFCIHRYLGKGIKISPRVCLTATPGGTGNPRADPPHRPARSRTLHDSRTLLLSAGTERPGPALTHAPRRPFPPRRDIFRTIVPRTRGARAIRPAARTLRRADDDAPGRDEMVLDAREAAASFLPCFPVSTAPPPPAKSAKSALPHASRDVERPRVHRAILRQATRALAQRFGRRRRRVERGDVWRIRRRAREEAPWCARRRGESRIDERGRRRGPPVRCRCREERTRQGVGGADDVVEDESAPAANGEAKGALRRTPPDAASRAGRRGEHRPGAAAAGTARAGKDGGGARAQDAESARRRNRRGSSFARGVARRRISCLCSTRSSGGPTSGTTLEFECERWSRDDGHLREKIRQTSPRGLGEKAAEVSASRNGEVVQRAARERRPRHTGCVFPLQRREGGRRRVRRRQREKKRRTEGLGNATHAEVNTIDDREIHPLARRAGDDDARYPRFPFGEEMRHAGRALDARQCTILSFVRVTTLMHRPSDSSDARLCSLFLSSKHRHATRRSSEGFFAGLRPSPHRPLFVGVTRVRRRISRRRRRGVVTPGVARAPPRGIPLPHPFLASPEEPSHPPRRCPRPPPPPRRPRPSQPRVSPRGFSWSRGRLRLLISFARGSADPGSKPNSRSLCSHTFRANLGSLAGRLLRRGAQSA